MHPNSKISLLTACCMSRTEGGGSSFTRVRNSSNAFAALTISSSISSREKFSLPWRRASSQRIKMSLPKAKHNRGIISKLGMYVSFILK